MIEGTEEIMNFEAIETAFELLLEKMSKPLKTSWNPCLRCNLLSKNSIIWGA